MTEKFTKGETHGCVVCGRLFQIYAVYDESGKFIDCMMMSSGAKCVSNPQRPLVACETHSKEQIEAAVIKAYGEQLEDDES